MTAYWPVLVDINSQVTSPATPYPAKSSETKANGTIHCFTQNPEVHGYNMHVIAFYLVWDRNSELSYIQWQC